MTAVMVEIQPPPPVQPTTAQDPNDVVLVEDVAALIAETLPGCNDDNPYN
ncbi:hypothetical protein ACIP79_41540 [Streptomyces sp. NPDC088747]